MHTVIESDRQCARDLLAGFAHTQPPVEFMLEQVASHIAAHRESESAIIVLTKTPATRAFLLANDPKALEQAELCLL